jgi:hypothetical protein
MAYNAIILTPDRAYKVNNYNDDTLMEFFPDGFEVCTSQGKTGIWDYYILFFDAENGKPFNKNARWIIELPIYPSVVPTGNFIIVRKKWDDVLDDETTPHIDKDLKDIIKLFK